MVRAAVRCLGDRVHAWIGWSGIAVTARNNCRIFGGTTPGFADGVAANRHEKQDRRIAHTRPTSRMLLTPWEIRSFGYTAQPMFRISSNQRVVRSRLSQGVTA
jgi:hypothetical protein